MIIVVVIISIITSICISVFGTIYTKRNYIKNSNSLNFSKTLISADLIYNKPENVLTVFVTTLLLVFIYLRVGQMSLYYIKYFLFITFYIISIYTIYYLNTIPNPISIVYFTIALILQFIEFNNFFQYVWGSIILFLLSVIFYKITAGFLYKEDIILFTVIGLSLGVFKTLIFILLLIMIYITIVFILLLVDNLKSIKNIRISSIMFIVVVLIILTLG